MDQGAKSYWAEFLGTFTLCFVGQGSICVQQMLGSPAGALLAVAVAHGLALAVMISALGSASGGHFNPAVTFGFLVTGRQSAGSAALYVISQLAGATVASFLLRGMFPTSVWQSAHLGAAALSPEVSSASGVLIEAVLTFFLVTAVWGTTVDPRAPRIGGFGIGLAVTMGILMGGPLTGAALNPARAYGAALAAGFWPNHWIYWLGPLLGGGAAGLVYARLVLGKEAASKAP